MLVAIAGKTWKVRSAVKTSAGPAFVVTALDGSRRTVNQQELTHGALLFNRNAEAAAMSVLKSLMARVMS